MNTSRTALLAVLARASLRREPEPLRGRDELAERFLDAPLRWIVEVEPLRKLVLRIVSRRMPGAYGHVLARSIFLDALVESELSDGATQLVVLGAGYDTRAYRFASLFSRGGRAFEVDAKGTSARKQALVRSRMGGLPPHVTYVPLDLNRHSLSERLTELGYDPEARTVVVAEGLTFYVGQEAIDSILRLVSNAGPQSVLGADFISRRVVQGTDDRFGASETSAAVHARKEPFTFGLDAGEIEAFMAARGLSTECLLEPPEMERRYLGGSVSSPIFRVGGFYTLVAARRLPPAAS